MRNKFKVGNQVNLGRKMTLEIKKKISDSMKGRPATWLKGKVLSKEHREKITKALIGNKYCGGNKRTKESIEQQINSRKGYRHSEQTRRKMSLSAPRGVKNHLWKGGITTGNRAVRTSLEYKLWRDAVFKRDNWTCVWCGVKFIKGVTGKVILNADHIKAFSKFPELRFAIDNGRTLCLECHKTTDTYAGKSLKKKPYDITGSKI